MGTIVLSPQDCLSSSHNRQNYYFTSATKPDIGRRRSQALMVSLPAAEDCARHDYSGGSPPGDGLLPVPSSLGQARALSKRPPFPVKSSSILCTPSAGRTAATATSSSPIVKLSRSASAILPTPLVTSPPALEGDGLHLLKGRLPFKIVQGNGPGISKVDVVQRSSAKKPSGAQKKSVISGQAVNVKVKGGHQGSRLALQPLHDGAFFKGQPRKVDARNERSLERSHSVKGPREKCDQNGGIPVITILQRPQSKEAAAELLTKFLQKNSEQEVVCVKERLVNGMPNDVRNHPEMIGESEVEQQKSTDGLPDSEAFEDRLYQILSSPCSTTDVLGAVASKYLEGSSVADKVSLTVSSTLGTQSDVIFSSSRGTLGDASEELAPWERWAGPSYINSPPPSALPLPRFSRKQLKIESRAASDLFDEIVSDQASTPPSSMSPLYAYLSDRRQLGTKSDAATKDLKRILNLDSCRM